MTTQIKINGIGTGKVSIDTPYNPAFVQRVKSLGARWSPTGRTWTADERNLDAVRAAMREVYGMDDIPARLVSVRVTVTEEVSEWTAPVTLFGRIVASARGRDSGARIGEGVAFESGSPDSGGSMKNWRTIVPAGCVIVIHDVPETAVESKIGWHDTYGTFEIVRPAATDRAALETEKAALLARLAEIEATLGIKAHIL